MAVPDHICPATAGMTLRLLVLLANVVAAKGVHSAPVSRGVTGGKPNRIAYCVVMKASSGGAEALNQLAIAGQGVPGWTVLGIGYRLQQGPFGSHAYPQLASVGRGGTIKASNRASGEVNEGYYVAPPLPRRRAALPCPASVMLHANPSEAATTSTFRSRRAIS